MHLLEGDGRRRFIKLSRDAKNRVLGLLLLAALSAVLILIVGLVRGRKGISAGKTVRDFAMGSTFTATLYGEKEKRDTASAEVVERIKELDEKVISRRSGDSELARWNRDAGTEDEAEPYRVSSTLYQAVYQGDRLSEICGGSLDLTLRPVLDVWGIEDSDPDTFRVPSDQELQAAAGHTGMHELAFRENVIERARKDITLDLGAIGKGYALDIAYQYLTGADPDRKKALYNPEALKDCSITGGVIVAGGSVMVFGSKPDGTDFQVGVRDPDGLPEDLMGVISIPSGAGKTCISTSGGYEKYIEKDGVRYHHIIDPGTLKPAESGLKSVTVVCGEDTGIYGGLISDGLSTACFIMGETRALGYLEQCRAEAVMIRDDGSILVTEGLKDRFSTSY